MASNQFPVLKIIKAFMALIMLPVLLMAALPATFVQDQPDSSRTARTENDGANRIRTVVIDAGHGGKDPGCMTRRHRESRIVLKIALQLARDIKREMPKIRVIMTRATDHFVELAERGAIANRNKADLFISIHVNASPSSKAVHGTETYTLGLHKTEGNLEVAKRENAVILQEANYRQTYKGFNPDSPLAHIMLANYQHAFMGSSINFAEKIERSFRKNADRKSNGVKQAGFVVLWRTTMPSVLIETGYLTNPAEEVYLASEEGQEEIAMAIYKAFAQYKDEMESAN
jgi:N-acetylmuramoyl-L-alanine amidase